MEALTAHMERAYLSALRINDRGARSAIIYAVAIYMCEAGDPADAATWYRRAEQSWLDVQDARQEGAA